MHTQGPRARRCCGKHNVLRPFILNEPVVPHRYKSANRKKRDNLAMLDICCFCASTGRYIDLHSLNVHAMISFSASYACMPTLHSRINHPHSHDLHSPQLNIACNKILSLHLKFVFSYTVTKKLMNRFGPFHKLTLTVLQNHLLVSYSVQFGT